MRITFVLPPVNMSGGLRVVAIYAQALTQRGHSVTIISPPRPALQFKAKLKLFLKGRTWPTKHHTPSHFDQVELDHRILDRYRPVVDDDVPDADLVIATWWETAEWVAALSGRKGAKVYFIQGHEVFGYLPVERCRATYSLPLQKIVVSKWLADLMRDEYGDDNVYLVPNSVDHQQFHAPVRGKQAIPTVGFLYNEAQVKGVDVVLTVLDRLRCLIPELRATCFGTTPPSGLYRLGDYVEFHLSPPQDSIRDIYQCCDVWLSASRSEGFNLTAMEAMACRVPVVSTRTGWPAEAIVSRENGVLTEINDVEGLVRGVDWVLNLDDKAWRTLSVNAYRKVEESSWENAAQQLESALFDINGNSTHGFSSARLDSRC